MSSSSSMIATGGLLESSSLRGTTSISGMLDAEGEEDGVTAAIVDKASLSDSALSPTSVASPPFVIFEGVAGESGEGDLRASTG